MLNFDYLNGKAGFTRLYDFCHTAEITQISNPDESALNSRRALEYLVDIIYYLKSFTLEPRANLFQKVDSEDFKAYINDRDLMMRLHYIRKVGNNAAHTGHVTRRESGFSLLNLYVFVGSVLKKIGLIEDYPEFDESLIPQQAPIHASTPEDSKPDTSTISQYSGKLDTPLVVDKPKDLTEAETRKRFIDLMLRDAGWEICTEDGVKAPGKACVEIYVQGMPNNKEEGYVDYVLYDDDLKPLAIIEAKRTSKSRSEGYHQAKLYAECLKRECGYEPLYYCSNGFFTEVFDMLGYPKREVYAFHSKKDLQTMRQNRNRQKIADMRVNRDIAGRDYQERAIKRVCESFNDRRRHALLVMATGTGKTRTAIGVTDVLMRNNWAKSILFLADRRSLVRQANRNFVKLLPNVTTCVLSDTKPSERDLNARIIFSTYQTMIKYIDADQKDFSVGRFSLIFIDEAHRSVFGKFGAIFDYFDALLVGMTATPREEVDRSTYDIFKLEQGVPTDEYPYKDAIRDEWLVPYRQKRKHSAVMNDGIQYDQLTQEEKDQLEKIWDYETTEDGLNIETVMNGHRDIRGHEIFKYVYNKDTVRRVFNDLFSEGLRINNNDVLGKTIIFAFNHDHAQLIVDVFNEDYATQYGREFCQLIDNRVNYAEDLIDRFSDPTKMPQIAVSVDMLDTGIDVPEVLNLVFFKKVLSKIKFNQMIGRGTRLCSNLLGAGKDKKEFYIFDYCANFEYFNENPDGQEPATPVSLTERLFNIRTVIAKILQRAEFQENEFTKNMHDGLKDMLHKQVCELNENRIDVRRHLEHVFYYKQKENWIALSDLDCRQLEWDVAPLLPRPMDEMEAKAFDFIMLNLQLSCIEEGHDRQAEICKNKVIMLAGKLEQKASIPQVMAKMKTIKEVQSTVFWKSLTLSNLERVREELRELIQFLVGKSKKTFTVDIEDIITPAEGGDLPIDSTMSYKERVMDYLVANNDSPVFKKIKNLEQLEAGDIRELERIFWQELGSKEDYDRFSANALYGGNIAAFIRSMTHVDYAVAIRKFQELLQEENLNATQMEYLRSIIAYVSQYGDIEREKIGETEPFRHFDWIGAFGDKASHVVSYITDLHNVIVA